MPKNLKISQPEMCNGCELCLLETQRQLKKVGFEEALIRIFRSKTAANGYVVEIDPRVNMLDVEKLKTICPKNVFEIEQND